MMNNSYLSDIRYAARLLRLNVLSKRFYIIWGITIIVSLAMIPVYEDFSYPALMMIITTNLLQQMFLMLTVSDMFISSPYERDILQRAANRLSFLVYLVVYVCLATANVLVAEAVFHHAPAGDKFLILACFEAVYRIASVGMYIKRWMSYLLGGAVGALAACTFLYTDTSRLPFLGHLSLDAWTYPMEIALGVGILFLGEEAYRAFQKALWKKPIDKRIFDTTLKRFKYGR